MVDLLSSVLAGSTEQEGKRLKAKSEFTVLLQDTTITMIKLNGKQTVCDHDWFQSKVIVQFEYHP